MSVMLLLVYVVPQFEQTFAQAGKALPLPTQIVIFVGTGVQAVVVGDCIASRLCVLWIRRRLPQSRVARAGTRACCARR